mmetsp:Transcript_8469/g.29118  ORF Transcript_8469/g.29118 Transcript_8469/m.29118 type:complete len:204 (-) Transcript_8469:181-792(-)
MDNRGEILVCKRGQPFRRLVRHGLEELWGVRARLGECPGDHGQVARFKVGDDWRRLDCDGPEERRGFDSCRRKGPDQIRKVLRAKRAQPLQRHRRRRREELRRRKARFGERPRDDGHVRWRKRGHAPPLRRLARNGVEEARRRETRRGKSPGNVGEVLRPERSHVRKSVPCDSLEELRRRHAALCKRPDEARQRVRRELRYFA